MRIVGYEEFKEVPIGTLFCEYEPCIFGEIKVFTGASDCDFYYQELNHPIPSDSTDDFVKQCEKMEKGEELTGDYDNTERDGMFNHANRKFLIYNKEDVVDLIEYLKALI